MYKKHEACFFVCWAISVAYELCCQMCFLLTGYVLIRTWTLSSTCPRLLSSGARTRLFLSGRLFPGEQNLKVTPHFGKPDPILHRCQKTDPDAHQSQNTGTVGLKMDPFRAMDAVDNLWLQFCITLTRNRIRMRIRLKVKGWIWIRRIRNPVNVGRKVSLHFHVSNSKSWAKIVVFFVVENTVWLTSTWLLPPPHSLIWNSGTQAQNVPPHAPPLTY